MEFVRVFFFVFLGAFSFSYSDEINSWGQLIKKGNIYLKKTTKKPFTGVLKNFYPTGEVSLIDNFKDGKQHGDFKSFHKNGKLSMKGKFIEGMQHGEWFEYYDDGSLFWNLKYINGKKEDGIFQMFHKNGKIHSEVTLKNGEPITNWVYFDDTGEKERIDIYKDGQFFYEKHLK